MKSVDIIIVNYNVTNELKNCIDSINKHMLNLPVKVIVVDNNSPDKTFSELINIFPNVKFFCLDENIGYSGANNLGVSKSNSDYILFLNPDTVIIEDILSPIIEFIEMNSNTGACGPMLLNDDLSYQNSSGNAMGILYETAEAFMVINIYRKIDRIIKRKKLNSRKPFEIGWVSGACMLVNRSIIEQLGGFCEEYFLNYEDINLCRRIQEIGYKNYYFPYLKCVHLNQKSQKQDYEALVYSRYKSRLVYSKNQYNFIERILVRFIHVLGLSLRLVFVNILYSQMDKKQRRRGYMKSLLLYLNFSNK